MESFPWFIFEVSNLKKSWQGGVKNHPEPQGGPFFTIRSRKRQLKMWGRKKVETLEIFWESGPCFYIRKKLRPPVVFDIFPSSDFEMSLCFIVSCRNLRRLHPNTFISLVFSLEFWGLSTWKLPHSAILHEVAFWFCPRIPSFGTIWRVEALNNCNPSCLFHTGRAMLSVACTSSELDSLEAPYDSRHSVYLNSTLGWEFLQKSFSQRCFLENNYI